jgi:hypothetical protein
MLNPDAFWRSVRPDGPWQDALAYAVIVMMVGAVLGVALAPLNTFDPSELNLEKLPPEMREKAQQYLEWALKMQGSAVQGIFTTLIAAPLLVLVQSAILHLFVLLYGADRHGFQATFRVSAYAAATMVFSSVPVLNVLSQIYVLIQLILGVMHVQETTGTKASLAVLTIFFALCCCCCVGLVMVGGSMAAALKGGAM